MYIFYIYRNKKKQKQDTAVNFAKESTHLVQIVNVPGDLRCAQKEKKRVYYIHISFTYKLTLKFRAITSQLKGTVHKRTKTKKKTNKFNRVINCAKKLSFVLEHNIRISGWMISYRSLPPLLMIAAHTDAPRCTRPRQNHNPHNVLGSHVHQMNWHCRDDSEHSIWSYGA